jgi:hypothetical protein
LRIVDHLSHPLAELSLGGSVLNEDCCLHQWRVVLGDRSELRLGRPFQSFEEFLKSGEIPTDVKSSDIFRCTIAPIW